MKACLMKVNYDPRYTTPHNHQNKPFESLQVRLNATKDIYARHGENLASRSAERTQPSVTNDEKSQRKIKSNNSKEASVTKMFSDTGSSLSTKEKKHTSSMTNIDLRTSASTNILKDRSKTPSPSKPRNGCHLDTHKEGVARAHIKLQPIRSEEKVTYSMLWPRQNTQLSRLFNGPYTEKMVRKNSQFQTSLNLYPNIQRRSLNASPVKTSSSLEVPHRANSLLSLGQVPFSRSRTAPEPGVVYKSIKSSAVLEMERRAKVEAERAIKCRKVFTIAGPYPTLRRALRRRGWVEKFMNAPMPGETKKRASSSTDDDDTFDTKENKAPPWEEENGLYGMMSYMVRNCTPTFVFTVKSNEVDSRVMKGNQLVNHFGKARNFTTKAGLVQNLRQLYWFNNTDCDTIYPRSYKLDESEDKEAFLEDYRLTACMSFMRYFVTKYEDYDPDAPKKPDKSDEEKKSSDSAVTRCYYKSTSHPQLLSDISINMKVSPTVSPYNVTKPKSHPTVSVQALEVAIQQCERLLAERLHNDIDDLNENVLNGSQWGQFLMWYYQFVHEDGELSPYSPMMVLQCKELLSELEEVCPQASLDGYRNAWILKPGAKSRGRGIQCFDKLEVINSAVESTDSCMVVQKYIERPFLVHKTKFDIRQWFLVTDWNPLTLWFYKHCYLRFCSQEFTLDNFHSSIHLSNNAIQKHFTPAGLRCDKLPDDNMWTSEQFITYLRSVDKHEAWLEVTVPGMKHAIISTLLCTQEFIECRKSAFELYGADFMLTEDMRPWLLEVNSSPSMCRSTKATARLVDMVLEDTLKVVLDRRDDKNADTGHFELAYRQAMINDPPPTDPSLTVHGKRVNKKNSRR